MKFRTCYTIVIRQSPKYYGNSVADRGDKENFETEGTRVVYFVGKLLCNPYFMLLYQLLQNHWLLFPF